MKKILILIIAIFLTSTFGCEPRSEKLKADYCMEIKLIDGTITQDTFNVIKGSKFEISHYRGAYGLKLTTETLFELYGHLMTTQSDGFLRYGV